MKPSVDIYLDEEYDRFDTNIEFYIDPNHTFSISIDPSGDIAWAYLWGEHEDHGSGSLFKKEKSTNDWQNVAMKLGEKLALTGPEGYYDFTPDQWLEWAKQILEKRI